MSLFYPFNRILYRRQVDKLRDKRRGTVMENKYYAEEIKELKLDQLEDSAGGASNEVKCPICKKYYPIHAMKAHLRDVHGK